ncbi:RHS repeat-associated protein [Stenotrophomonas sp. AN71]|uniref:RHS repeat-associated core domain-containing protein n=1 Tax=Stenotrophomonas sp. AN71 TaxID=3156253 RepID=UPI003D20F4C1
MRRFGGTAGGVFTRFRGFEDRIRRLGAFGAWLCCVLLIGLGLPPSAIAQTTVTYIHTDALGSVVAESDANGNVIKRYDYEPYGAVVGGQVTDGPGYTGHVSDSATGLSYMQQRYMDPQLGVFLSVDPVTAYEQPVGQFNRYRYANGNPYKFTDPDGRQAIPMPAPYILPIPVPSSGGNIQRSEDTSGGNRESGPSGRPTSRPTERPAGRDTVRRGRDGQPIPNRFPDRPLPTKPNGEPAPDPDAAGPHTQLGQRDGRNGKYDQAREFDGRGRPVKTIDFTDHGRPGSHTNPHEHPYEPSATGGTPSRGPARPLNGGG